MDNISYITDHATQAGNRVIDWFKGGTFQELVEALAGRYQGLEDVVYPLIEAKYLANATGATLDGIGLLVGIARTVGQTDDAYRVLIYAKIAANISEGRMPDIYNIMSTLQATNIKGFDMYPAAIHLQYGQSPIAPNCGCIRRILEGVDDTNSGATAPIEIDLVQDISESGIPFGFAGTVGAGGFGVGSIGLAG